MSSATRASSAFKRIVDWAAGHAKAKAILNSLRDPATNAAVSVFEKKAKLKLPPALAALYKLHDGQDEDAANKGRDVPVEVGLFPSLESGDLPFLLVPLKQLKRNT